MSMMRSVLLAASESPWLREHAPRAWFVRRAVRRFMPGERLEDAMAAAAELQRAQLGTVFTHLGENVTGLGQADTVARDYLDVLRRLREAGLDTEISVKLTHLGLDIDRERCAANLRALVSAARAVGNYVWIDMEQHPYVDATLDLYRRARQEFANVGVCLQAYLHRTLADLASLLPLGPGIRLVKGAYREPASVAHPEKRDVDAAYLALAKAMLGPEAARAGVRAVFGTHDLALVSAISGHAAGLGLAAPGVEFHLLYGIQQGEQRRLVSAGHRVRVLISYGDFWFPWYMRRLAERPANVWFVVKNVLPR
jgi:proline dehydrogenase